MRTEKPDSWHHQYEGADRFLSRARDAPTNDCAYNARDPANGNAFSQIVLNLSAFSADRAMRAQRSGAPFLAVKSATQSQSARGKPTLPYFNVRRFLWMIREILTPKGSSK